MRVFIGLLLFVLIGFGLHSQSWNENQFREKTIIFKVKDEYKSRCEKDGVNIDEFNERLQSLDAVRVFQKFPNSKPADPSRTAVAPDPRVPDISLIYELNYEADVPLLKAIHMLQSTGLFEYVEGAPIYQVCLVPSDTRIQDQYHLGIIKAFEAWDVDTGSSDITIAIVDTGVDWDHPDLVDNIQYNKADPIDGLDNDENGYIDDYRGWNFHDDNNDPDELSWSHGTHVAGLAGATTNNNFGVAGTGYACRILPVKAGNQLQITHGYEGVVYAAENGARVINCSWGGSTYSFLGEDVMRYVVFKLGCVVTGGAGNDNRDTEFYPASFPFVISVGATNSLDIKADFSNYNYKVDLLAPGKETFSTENDTLEYESGTSMSAPIVAGAAALVMNHFPQLDPLQIAEQLITTTDDIFPGPDSNYIYRNKLGSGRLNMRRALDSIISPAVRIENIEISDGADEIYTPGDIVYLELELANYLLPTNELTVVARSLSSNVIAVDSLWRTNALSTNGRVNNGSKPFTFQVIGEGEYNEMVDIRLEITDGDYLVTRFVQFAINQDYANLNINNISTTVSSRGNIGYADDRLQLGLGFRYENLPSFIYDGGLMIGVKQQDQIDVVDRLRNDQRGVDQDFRTLKVIRETMESTRQDFIATGKFNDDSALRDRIGLEVSQRALASTAFGEEDYVIVEYTIKNTSGEDIPEMYVGLCVDWDIVNADKNRGLTESGRKLGYLHYVNDEELSAGVQLLSDYPFYSYMIDNESITSGVNLFEDGYSTEEKFTTLSTNRYEAGVQPVGNDVIQVVSAGGIALREGEEVTVAFALMAARSREAIVATADSAYKNYNGYFPGENIYKPFQLVSLGPNPADDDCLIEFDLQETDELTFQLINSQGMPMGEVLRKNYFQGRNLQLLSLPDVPSGTYVLQVKGTNFERNLLLQIVESN